MSNCRWPKQQPPLAARRDHVREIHGEKVNDPYYWLNDFFKKGPLQDEVIEYLKAENDYFQSMMADTQDLQEKIYQEIRGRIKENDESVPVFKRGYFYYTRTFEGEQYCKYYRKKGSLEAKEELILDVDQLAQGKPYYMVGDCVVSPDNQWLAYTVDDVSRRQYRVYFKNLNTGEIIDEGISQVSEGLVWAQDSQHIFYVVNNEQTLLSEKIVRHRLGTSAQEDVVVYEEKDPTNYIWISRSKNDQYLLIQSQSKTSSEVYYIKSDEPTSEFKLFQARQKDVIYDVFPLEDCFLILTNKGAINFQIMKTPLSHTGVEYWEVFVPHREEVLIEDLEEFAGHFVLQERYQGLIRLNVIHRETQKSYYIHFDEPTYTVSLMENPEYETDQLRYEYASMVTPYTQYEENLNTQEKVVLKEQEVLGGYDKSKYVSERLYVVARDGVSVPVSIVYAKDRPKDGSKPLLLYAYGSYGSSVEPSFRQTFLSLVDRGFAFAVAHIRGGGEMGRQWYEDGKMMKKKNTFFDFIDCAKYLIEAAYTSPQHLYAQGGSAGGLLMGAVINYAPELFNGVLAEVPFVDVVNTMLDESIPLTTNEYDEWGNPNEEPAYHYMKSYSPYENVEAKAYPNLLVTTGLYDSQVQYFEPAKWVAKLRDTKIGDQVVLLRTDMDYGHGGASGRFDYIRQYAMDLSFLLKLEGIDQ